MVEKSTSTDDNRFEFVLIFYIISESESAALDVKIYANKDNGYKYPYPLFSKTGVENNEFVNFKLLSPEGYILEGYIKPIFTMSKQEIVGDVYSNFNYGKKGYEINFSGQLISEVILDNPSPPSPPDPFIKEDESRPTDLYVDHTNHSDLFPYVYMKKWPGVDEKFVNYNFIMYTRNSIDKNENDVPRLLIDTLIDDNSSRQKMNQDAIEYIENIEVEDISYLKNMQTLSNKDIFNEPINQFYQYSLELNLPIDDSPIAYKKTLLNYFGTTEEILKNALTNDDTYKRYKELCWQSYFALIFVLGYDDRKLRELTVLLRVCYTFELLFTKEGIDKNMCNDELNHALLATICLPEKLFNSDSDSLKTNIIPYAIGTLHLVKQKLCRYELGEVSDIINVLNGEVKEIKSREQLKNETVIDELSSETTQKKNNTIDDQTEYINEIKNAMKENSMTTDYQNLEVTYGPHNMIYGGKVTNTGPNHMFEFSKKITTEAASNMSKTISSLRKKTVSSKTENIITSHIDNTNGPSDKSGIYRWVNKIYKNYVVNYGQRLMYEIEIEKPASQFISKELFLKGENLNFPVSPLELGISKYSDIKPNRKEFNKLYLHYNNLVPPKDVEIELNDSLTGVSSKTIIIPNDYEAINAKALLLQVNHDINNEEKYQIQIAVGTTKIESGKEAINIAKTTGQINLTVTGLNADDYIINFKIGCRLRSEAIEEWQATTYKRILEEYKNQWMSYYKLIEELYGQSRGDWNVQLVKDAMIKCCKHAICQNYIHLTTQDSKTDEFDNEYRILQFVNILFEWDKMYFTFSEKLKASLSEEDQCLMDVYNNYGEVFNQFLMADYSQVILPVREGCELMSILFIDTGLLWDGHENNCCCSSDSTTNDSSLEIIAALKSSDKIKSITTNSTQSWETKLATGMQMLDSHFNVNNVRNENDNE